MKVTVIIVIGALDKGPVKGLEDLEIRGQEETIQTTAKNYSEKPSDKAGVKNFKKD